MDTFPSSTAAWWQRHIEAHASSGLPVAGYCATHDLSPSTFYLWRRKLSAASPPRATFTELLVEPPAATAAAAPIELHHPSGWRICLGRNFSRSDLERLLDTLQERR